MTPHATTVEMRLQRIDDVSRTAGLDVRRTRQAVEQIAAENARAPAQLESLRLSAAASVALQDHYLSCIVGELQFLGRAMQAQLAALERIEDLLANPADTASQEYRRRGESLLARSLLPEAEAEFSAALKTSPYDPIAHYRLGQVLTLEGHYAKAGDSFAAAVRYSSHPPFTAAACLMAAAAYRQTGNNSREDEIIAHGCNAIPDCAELWLASARANGGEQLGRALTIAPELVFDASAAKLPALERASRAVLDAGYLEAANRYASAVIDLTTLVRKAGQPADYSTPSKPSSPTAWSLLAWSVLVHAEAPQKFSELTSRALAIPVPSIASPKVKTEGAFKDALGLMAGLLFLALPLFMAWVPLTAHHVFGIGIVHSFVGTFIILATLAIGFPWYMYARNQSKAADERRAIRQQSNTRALAEGRGRDLKKQIDAIAVRLPHHQRPSRVIPYFI